MHGTLRWRRLAAPVAAAVALGALGASCGDDRAKARGAALYDADGRLMREVSRPSSLPNLVLILVDTLRHDMFPIGSAGGAMPFLASIASRGVACAQASAPAPWTLPSVTSLLTGLLPADHGANDVRRPPFLPAAVPTFAEILANGWGYETAALADGPFHGPNAPIFQGFRHVDLQFGFQNARPAIEEWARRRRDPRKPFFLYVHCHDAHDPYGPEGHPWPASSTDPKLLPSERLAAAREPWQQARAFFLDRPVREALWARDGPAYERTVLRYMSEGYAAEPRPDLLEELRVRYAEGVRWADGSLSKAVAAMEDLGLLKDTLLVVTSDHGEAFAEHGILAHARQLYDELVRVPLVMTGPAPFDGGRVVNASIGTIDVLPTFLDWAKIPLPRGIEGRSMLPVLRGESDGHPVRAEEVLSPQSTGLDTDAIRVSVRTERWKWVLSYERRSGTVTEELYDLAADPKERHDLGGFRGRKGVEVGEEFCEAVVLARERVYGVKRSDQRTIPPYGHGQGAVVADPPDDCPVRRP